MCLICKYPNLMKIKRPFIMCSMFFVISMYYKSIVTMFTFKNFKLSQIQKYEEFDTNKSSKDLKKFRLNKEELVEFHNSLDRVNEMNNCLITRIQNFTKRPQHDDFSIHSLDSIEEYINILTETRKNSENSFTFEYEYIKFCEFFYLSLFYILKYRKNLEFDFFIHSQCKIIPILKKMKSQFNLIKFNRYFDFLEEKLHILKISNSDRHRSLRNFLFRFIVSMNVIISYDCIDENIPQKDLLTLCLHVFLGFYLSKQKNNASDFFKNFSSLESLLSFQFRDFLLENGAIIGLVIDTRIKHRQFLLKNNIDYETLFVQQKIIPTVADILNKDFVKLCSLKVTYKKK